jgi:hypothetical protein
VSKIFIQAKRDVFSLPEGFTNVAAAQNRAKATASSYAQEYRFKEQIDQLLTLNFSPQNAINGNRMPENWGRGNGWMDGNNHEFPKWFQVEFPEVKSVDTVVVHTFPEHVAGHNRRGLRNYEVQCFMDGSWRTVDSVCGNVKGTVVHRFPEIRTTRIRLWITGVNLEAVEDFLVDDQEYARLLEIEAYHFGNRSIQRAESWTVEIEKGEKGSVAIYRDAVPNWPGSTDPDFLGQMFRKAGYGVTFLDGRSLAIHEIFNADNFNIFIHPYGPFFPTGTCLYEFLGKGGHLITTGGYAFTNALLEIDGKWQATGYDPGINMTVFRLSDCPYNWRDQLGIFTTPEFTLDGATFLESTKGIPGIGEALKLEGSFRGRGAAGIVGESIPFAEEEQLTREGRWPEYAHATRAGVRQLPPRPFTGCLQPELTETYSWLISRARSRWHSLLDAKNTLGQKVAPAGAMIENHYGPYRGSCWAFFGVDNVDLFSINNPQMHSFLLRIAEYFTKDCLLHSAMPELACYHAGETPCAKVWVDNFQPMPRTFEVQAVFTSRDTGKSQTFTQTIQVPSGGWNQVDFYFFKPAKEDSFIQVHLSLLENGKLIDNDETAFVVWNEKIIAKGRKFEYRDNFFYENGKAVYLSGCRFSDFNVHGQPLHTPYDWDRDFQMMRDNGLEVASNVFFDYYIPGFSWGKELNEVIPNPLLRQLDATIQLAQHYGLIYAPTPFFVNERLAKENVELSRKICRLLGKRYKKVPGIFFYLWDDGLRMDPDKFNTWIRECIEALNSHGRKFIVTAEFTCRVDGSDVVRACAKHLDFLALSCYQAVGDPIANKLLDMRSTGKNLSAAEFTSPIDWYGNLEIRRHGHFAEPHNMFGMGHCLAVNYEWLDETKASARFGLVTTNDKIPKHLFWILRNQALFFRQFSPKYEPKKVCVVLPMSRWLSNGNLAEGTVGSQMAWVWSQFFPAKIIKKISQHLRSILDCGVDYEVIDDIDLDRLSPQVRTLIYPFCYGLDEKTYNQLKQFVNDGGTLYLAGDPTFDVDSSERKRMSCLEDLFGAEYINLCVPDKQDLKGPVIEDLPPLKVIVQDASGERIGSFSDLLALCVRAGSGKTFGKCTSVEADSIILSTIGKGKVWYTPSVSDNLPHWVWKEFFKFAHLPMPTIKPEDKIVNLFQHPDGKGEVSMVFYHPWPSRLKDFFWHAREHHSFDDRPEQIEFNSKGKIVTLAPSSYGYGLCGLNEHGEIWALETQGKVTLAGQTKWDGTAHVMAFSMDRKDVGSSDALCILPFSKGTVEVSSSSPLTTLSFGEMVAGRWKPMQTVSVSPDGTGKISFTLEDQHCRTIILLYSKKGRENLEQLVTCLNAG